MAKKKDPHMFKSIKKYFWIHKKARIERKIMKKAIFWLNYSNHIREHGFMRTSFGVRDFTVVKLSTLSDKRNPFNTCMGSSDTVAKVQIRNSFRNLEALSRLRGKSFTSESMILIAVNTFELVSIFSEYKELKEKFGVNYGLFRRVKKAIKNKALEKEAENRRIDEIAEYAKSGGYNSLKTYAKPNIPKPKAKPPTPSSEVCSSSYTPSPSSSYDSTADDNANSALLLTAAMAMAVG